MTNFGGDRYFGVVLCFRLFLDLFFFFFFFFNEWLVYGFLYFGGFHRSTIVHEFLESWLFKGFLRN